jgi:hypothetical protein
MGCFVPRKSLLPKFGPVLVPLCAAGTAFGPNDYPQGTPSVTFPPFGCMWDGWGRVFLVGEPDALVDYWCDDRAVLTIWPSGRVFFDPSRQAGPRVPMDITAGMTFGLNSFSLTILNFRLSISYGAIPPEPVTLQHPALVHLFQTPMFSLAPEESMWYCRNYPV